MSARYWLAARKRTLPRRSRARWSPCRWLSVLPLAARLARRLRPLSACGPSSCRPSWRYSPALSRRGTRPTGGLRMSDIRIETDSLGPVEVPADKLWGAQTQRSLEHFSIGQDLMPREMITAYAMLKRCAATVNHAGDRLDRPAFNLIVQVCDEIL